jgi:cell division protein FtsA
MIEPRLEEICQLALKEVRKNHFADMLSAGVVITGGTALMHGMTELAEQVFEMPVRIGVPTGISGLVDSVSDPRFSTGVGLILHAFHSEEMDADYSKGVLSKISTGLKRLVDSFF